MEDLTADLGLTIDCPHKGCLAKVGERCNWRETYLHVPSDRIHRARAQLAQRPRQTMVQCPECKQPAGVLCAHLRSGPPNWNTSYHSQRDVLAYHTLTDVVQGLTYPCGSPVRPGWIVKDKLIKKYKLRVLKVAEVGHYGNRHFWAATWDNRIWRAATFHDWATQLAKKAGSIDKLGDVVREPCTFWLDTDPEKEHFQVVLLG